MPRLQVHDLSPISTGSIALDAVIGGGLPPACVTDVYGAAATGKTQFAFQNAVMTCNSIGSGTSEPAVVFIDCAGSFRPERVAEIAEKRDIEPTRVLELISAVNVRSVSDQIVASERLEREFNLSKCRLVIVDDVTANFTTEMNDPEQIMERQLLLSSYVRDLAYIANRKGASVLLTNAVRSRGEAGIGEATGEIISQHSLFRLYFSRTDRVRSAFVEQPIVARKSVNFEIEAKGIP